MATRNKKKQRTIQLMASAALLSTTIAPYVMSAEELTSGQVEETNKALQGAISNSTQTTGDAATVAPEIEKTIDNESEITSSGGNTTTEVVDNGIINSTISNDVEAIPTRLAPTTLSTEAVTAPQTDFIWRQSISHTMKADPNGPMAEFITGYLNPYFTDAEIVQIGAAYYIQMTLVEKAYGFQTLQYLDADGNKHDVQVISSEGEKMEQVRVVRLPLIQDEDGISKIFVDSGELGYGAYTLFFNFEVPELPDQETAPEQTNNAIGINHSFTAVEVTPGTFGSVPGSFIENYLKPYFTNAQLVTIDNQKYIELTLIGKAYGVVSFEGADIISSVGEKLEQVRVIRIPAAKQSTHRVDAGEYGIYDLTFSFAVTDEQLASTEKPEIPAENLTENVFFLTEHSNPSYATFVNSTIKKADLITRNGEQFAQILITPSNFVKLNENGNYHIVDTLEDGSIKIEAKLTSSNTVSMPFIFNGKTETTVTFKFPQPLEGTVIEADRPFAITNLSKPNYAKIYQAATEKIDFIEKADGPYARIYLTMDSPIFSTITSGTVVSFTENTRIVEVKLDESLTAKLTFSNATGNATHEVTYSVREDIEKEKLPALYEGIASYLDIEEKTDVRFKYTEDSNEKAIELLEKAIVIHPYVDRVDQQIKVGMKFAANEEVTTITIYSGKIKGESWTAEETPEKETLVSGALDQMSFQLTLADGTVETIVVSAIVAGSFAKSLPASELVEKNAKFTFATGDPTIDNYMKSYINQANIVEVDGKLYADVTLTGNTYAYTHLKFDGKALPYASNGKLGKELVRVIRIPLDDNKKSVVSLNGGGHDNTFTFDFTPVAKTIVTTAADLTAEDQAIALEYSATNPANSWHSMAFPSTVKAASAKAVDGKVQVTLQVAPEGLNSFAVTQNDKQIASWSDASSLVVFTVDSLENVTFAVNKTAKQGTTDLSVHVKEVSINPAGALPVESIGTQPATPDTSKVDYTKFVAGSNLDESPFTEEAKTIAFTYSSLVDTIPSAAALGVIVPEATIVKKNNKYEVTLQLNPVRTDRFFVAQQGVQIATIDTKDEAPTQVTFTVDNLDDLFFYVDGVSGTATGGIETIIGAQITGFKEATQPEQPTTPETAVIELPAPDEIVEEHASFTFSTGDSIIDSYMKQLISQAQLVKIDGQLYADVQLTGNTFGYTHVRLTNYDGPAIAYASNGLSGKDLVRTIRIPLDAAKQASVAMFSEIEQDGKRKYDNVFTFDFTPVTKTIITNAADLTAQSQAIALEYSTTNPETSWHAAAFPSNVKAVSAKAINGKVQVTLQVATNGLNSFTVTQNGTERATWSSSSSLVVFTVDSLENLVFTVNKTAAQGTTALSVNLKEASLHPNGLLPVETVIVEPEQPTNPVDPEPEQPTNPVNPTPEQPATPSSVTHSFTAVEVTPGTFGSVPGSFIENYLKPYFTNAQLVTIDNKKYIELTLIGKAYGIASFEGAEWISSTGEKLDQVRVIRIPAAKASTHLVDAGEYGIYDLTFTFGITDEQLSSGGSSNPTSPSTPAPEQPAQSVITKPTAPSNTNNVIITKPSDLKLAKNEEKSIIFNFGTSSQPEVKKVLDTLKEMINTPKIKITSNNLLAITFKITPKPGIKKLRVMKNGQQLGIWTAPSATARIASLLPFFASNANEISFETDSLEEITFEAVDTNDKTITATPAVEVDKALATTPTTPTNPGTVTGGGTVGGAVVKPPVATDVESRESISYKMVSDPNGPMADFMTNYMNPYFSNAELVTVGGKNYIELTLTGKAYGFQNLRVTGGYKVISSEGEKMDQVRVIRFPAKKDVTIHVDSGDLGYGAYDLLFTFALSEEQMKNAAAEGTGGITAVQTITPQIISEGDVKFTIPAEASAIVTYTKKISAKLVNGNYNVDVTLMTETDLDTFVVKQGDKEIARWDKKNKSASLANNNVLSFTVESVDNLTFIASTKTRTLEAKVGATLPKKEVVKEASKDGRINMTYTMSADPNGPMADFIGNYLAPYFSDAIYVTENGNEFVEMTLTGKAYGFAKLQLIDANGKYNDIDIVSSTGEKMEQVRVIRFPLVQDKDGITKVFVDSGDLGYGAYTLFFKYNVPAKSGNPVATTAAPTITNPFKDIDAVYSKDDILALFAAGITTGTTENTFSPNANMTRAQFAVMVARALGVSSAADTQFKDVQGKWYAKEVQALVELGIINGVTDTKFKPGDKITRQQAAVMIHRMLKTKGYTNKTTAASLNFKDNAKVADYAKEAVAELQAQSILTGNDGKVNPKANLTRAQMAKILKNAADLVGLLD